MLVKKRTFTIVVVLALLLTTTLMSSAAPRDIPGDFAPSVNVDDSVECSCNGDALECLKLVIDNSQNKISEI